LWVCITDGEVLSKCIIVVGPESSGSMLIAKICAHALDLAEFGDWNGVGGIGDDKVGDKVIHRSLPYGDPPIFPNIKNWIEEYGNSHELYFVLTTRDISMSEVSRHNRWSKTFKQSTVESDKAREILTGIMKDESDLDYIIWSYESFMFLKEDYLQTLYDFIGVKSDFIPKLIDANRRKVGGWGDEVLEKE